MRARTEPILFPISQPKDDGRNWPTILSHSEVSMARGDQQSPARLAPKGRKPLASQPLSLEGAHALVRRALTYAFLR